VLESFSEGKPPRKSHKNGNMAICKEDFEYYKKFLDKNQLQETKFDTTNFFREIQVNDTFYDFHSMFSRHLKDLIKHGEDDEAFSQFMQSFPTCLPSRTQLRILFDTFKSH
jgi:hypothetical protein